MYTSGSVHISHPASAKKRKGGKRGKGEMMKSEQKECFHLLL